MDIYLFVVLGRSDVFLAKHRFAITLYLYLLVVLGRSDVFSAKYCFAIEVNLSRKHIQRNMLLLSISCMSRFQR